MAGSWPTAGASTAATAGAGPRERADAFAAAFACAYGSAGCAGARAPDALALLRPGWARERLELRLCERAGTPDEIARERAAGRERADGLGDGIARLAALLALPTALGALALLAWLWRGRPAVTAGPTAIPPEWEFTAGLAVLVRAAAAGLAIVVAFALVELWTGLRAGALATSVAAALPLLWLVRRRLLAPRGLGFARALGLCPPRGGVLGALAWTLGLFAAGEIGARLIAVLGSRLGVRAHWSESWLETPLEAGSPATWAFALDAVAFGPLLEEIGCRGVLYLTLRLRSGAFAAALASAIVFGSLHPWSLAAFLATVWYGLVWALAFERTRSLWPGIACHAFHNAVVLGQAAVLYR